MQPVQVLQAVRRGFARASAEQVAVVGACRDLEVLDGEWVPRWALETGSALEAAGFAPRRMRQLFASGRGRVFEELGALVREGRRASVLESRHPYRPCAFDGPTQLALVAALRTHRAGCTCCRRRRPCAAAGDLSQELARLFPRDRRRLARS